MVAVDQDDLPPGFEGTAWTPTHSLSEESVQETPTTSSDVHVVSTSEAPAASRPEDVGEIKGTGDGGVSDSPSLVDIGTQVPSEPEEVYGEDIAVDAVEAADSVTHKPLDGIDEEEEENEIVPEGSKEDDTISPEVVGVPGSEVTEEATPHGEEPPSQTVAEEVFTEATMAILLRPTTVYPTEAGPLEDCPQDVSPTAGVKTEAAVEDVQETNTEGAESHEVEEPAGNSLDISTDVEVTEEEDTTVTETPPDAPESAETAVPGDAEGGAQMPPEERPSEADSEVSRDTIGVSTDTPPTVFLITSDDSEEAELEPVPDSETELPSQVTARPSVMTLQDETHEDVSFVTEATRPATAVGVTEATVEDKPEEERILVEAAEKPEEEVDAEEASVEEVESTTIITTETDVNEPTMTVSDSAEEELKNEDAAVVESEVVDTDEEKLTEEPEEAIFTAEDATEPSVQLTTEVGEMLDETATEREESTEVPGEQTKDGEETTEAPVELEEEQAEGPTEETVEIVEPPLETVKPTEALAEPQPEPTEETELIEESTNKAEHVETDVEEQREPSGEPVQEADVTKEVEEEEAPIGGSPQEPEKVSQEDESDLDVMPSENIEGATGEPSEDQEEATIVEIMTEDTGVSELETEATQPEVLEEATLETFDVTTPGSDEVITPIIAVVPEDTEGLLPETEVEELPEEEVKAQPPEDSELEVQPGTTDVPPQVLEPIEEVSDSEDFGEVEEEAVPEIPSVGPQEVVTYAWTSTKVGAIEPDKVTQDGFPKGHVISVEDSVLQEVEAVPLEAEGEDVEEIVTDAPVAATSESHREILPESTAETEPGTTMTAPEEPTSMTPLKPTPKYIVEYNNGNFPDITESPYFVDDLLGNNGFGLDEDENSVSFHKRVLRHRFTARRFSRRDRGDTCINAKQTCLFTN